METIAMQIIGIGITAAPLAGLFHQAYCDWRLEQDMTEKSEWIVEIETS
jgi:hypothetical protein